MEKTYSDLEQAYKKILTDNNGSFRGLCESYKGNCMLDVLKQHLNVIKTCKSGVIGGNCFPKEFFQQNGIKKTMNSTAYTQQIGAVLSNGSGFDIWTYDLESCTNQVVMDLTGENWPVCALIRVDVNGLAKPNIIGKDIYLAYVLANRIVPAGSIDDPDFSTNNPKIHCVEGSSNSTGYGCSAKYLME